MSYTVIWLPSAESELAALWLASPYRAAVTQASHQIDLNLQLNPESMGALQPDGTRLVYAIPLGVLFDVLPQDRLVKVLRVWHVDMAEVNGQIP